MSTPPSSSESGRLRVLHVGKYYPPVPGGMERVLQLLCENERPAVDSRVLVASTSRLTSREVLNGVPVTRAASLAMIGSVGLSLSLPFELRRMKADVTVVHEPNPMALLADFVTRRKGPLVVYFHSEVVRAHWKYRLFYRPLLARVLDRASRIIVASPSMAASAGQLSAHRDKCVVIPYRHRYGGLRAHPGRAGARRRDPRRVRPAADSLRRPAGALQRRGRADPCDAGPRGPACRGG